MRELAYVGGDFVSIREAKVSVEDRGFVFADGVYEVIVAYGGQPFRLREHLARLRCSADAIELALPKPEEEIEQIVIEGIRRSGFEDSKVYLQVTRGVAPRAHPFPQGVAPSFVATFREKNEVSPDIRRKGASVITTEDIRWARCSIKSIALLPNVLASQKAEEAGVFEAVFVTREGIVHEGAASNVFVVKDEAVFTPRATERILHGITREVVLECSRASGFETREETITVDDVLKADEVFLTGTTIEVLGVVEVDGNAIAAGSIGPVTKRIYQSFRKQIPAKT